MIPAHAWTQNKAFSRIHSCAGVVVVVLNDSQQHITANIPLSPKPDRLY